MRRENSDEDLSSSDPILDQMKSAFGEKRVDQVLKQPPASGPIMDKMASGIWSQEDEPRAFVAKEKATEETTEGPTRGELAINELKKKLEQNVLRDIEILQKRMVKQQRQVRKKTRRRICLICANPLQLSACKKLSCKHVFHTSCIHSWQTYFKTCPICYPPPPVK